MDHRHESDNSHLETLQVITFGSSETHTSSDSPKAHHISQPNPESPTAPGFPFSSGTLQQRRGVDSSASSIRQSSEGILFTSKSRSNVPSSPLNPARSIFRDSAFAPPPLRTLSICTDGASIKRALEKATLMKSTMLERDANGEIHLEKPWTEKKDPYIRISYILTYVFMSFGLIASGLLIYLSYQSTPKLPPLCLVLEDRFDTLDPQTWNREVDLGGFGNGQFEMTTDADENAYVKDGKLYITPTLTEDIIGQDSVLNGHTYNLTSCTNLISDNKGGQILNPDACGAVSNSTTGKIIPPVRSARLNTKGHAAIQYGKVTVRAKLPRGDWLWPAIWMLPMNDTYGAWPMSGEIDIMESRGNDARYPKQGRNYVRSTLNWGPTVHLNAGSKTYGWWYERRTSFDQGFHEYSLEWTQDYLYMYVDSRLHQSVDLRFNQPFFDRGDFPQVITNGTEQIALQNPWKGRSNSAPFDQPFYLILNVAVGGTNGWFPDGAGNKPWLDGSLTAMRDFYSKKDDWLSTWGSLEDRSLIVDSVKMWQACG